MVVASRTNDAKYTHEYLLNCFNKSDLKLKHPKSH